MSDENVFFPRVRKQNLNRPIMLYVGNITFESNLETFLELKTKGLKRIIGEGDQKEHFRHKYPYVQFLPEMTGSQLAEAIADADVVVYPHMTDYSDTIIMQAIACKTPVAAYITPITTPIIDNKTTGFCAKSLDQLPHR